MNIYTLTSIAKGAKDSRCWGFFSTIEKAREYLIDDKFDICECYYEYVVIEEFQDGIPATSPKFCATLNPDDIFMEWYKYNDREKSMSKWVKLKRPPRGECYKLVNWGMG